jgi:hypothetical protein
VCNPYQCSCSAVDCSGRCSHPVRLWPLMPLAVHADSTSVLCAWRAVAIRSVLEVWLSASEIPQPQLAAVIMAEIKSLLSVNREH